MGSLEVAPALKVAGLGDYAATFVAGCKTSSVTTRKLLEDMRSKRLDHRHVAGIASPRDDDATDARLIVARIERKPPSPEINLEPGVEVHGRRIGRHPDVAEITVHVARRNVHAAAERHGEMGEVTAHPHPLLIGFEGGPRRARLLIVERQAAVREVANGLHHTLARLEVADELLFFAFDLLHRDGQDLRPLPLSERRRRLARLISRSEIPCLHLVEAFDDGAKLLDAAERMQLEGIVSKRRAAPYRSGECRWRGQSAGARRTGNGGGCLSEARGVGWTDQLAQRVHVEAMAIGKLAGRDHDMMLKPFADECLWPVAPIFKRRLGMLGASSCRPGCRGSSKP